MNLLRFSSIRQYKNSLQALLSLNGATAFIKTRIKQWKVFGWNSESLLFENTLRHLPKLFPHHSAHLPICIVFYFIIFIEFVQIQIVACMSMFILGFVSKNQLYPGAELAGYFKGFQFSSKPKDQLFRGLSNDPFRKLEILGYLEIG